MDRFDFVVIGAGPGGYVAAIRAAQLGLRTALVEKDATLGGTCLNVGCIPSKALLESSEQYHLARHGLGVHGVRCADVTLDLTTLMARKGAIVKQLTDGIPLLMKKHKVKVLRGVGLLRGTGRVTVRGADGEQDLEAGAVCLAMGSVPMQVPSLPFDGRAIVSSTEALSWGTVPGRLVVVGAGAVGLELGSVWSRLGASVTVVEMLPRIAPFADAQMSSVLERALKAGGLAFRLETKVTAATVDGDGVTVTLHGPKGEETLASDKVLVAIGRQPCTTTAGIVEAGVALDERGRVRTDERYLTSVPGVYAIGDLVAGPMLAHKAEEEGVAVAEIVAGKPGHVNYGAIPNVIYTAPELACVGLTEEEVKQSGAPYRVGKSLFRVNGRAKSLAAEEGQVKVIAHAETDRLLGVHIVGARASDMIAEAVMAMEFKASAEDLARTSHAHPTLAEILKEAALAVDKRSING
ncbi:MAG: dihydrolipoyl dehydrogenase [Deltaproteobacteria bacterium]|nr:dihydrolipoyl dehydrogenase [Deltaproteobacteria bacterium]